MNHSYTNPPQQPPLRPYQSDALQAMRDYDGHAALCVMATGLGKTRVFTDYLRSEVADNDHHCLILSHREELVYQPLTYLPDLRCGVELAAAHAHGEYVVSASVQSLVGRLDRYDPRTIDTIIVDEAHHAAAPTYRKILEHFANATVFGFTATALRGDGVGLGCVFDDILFERDTLWGIEHGYLTPIKCCQVNLKYDMGSVKIEDNGDYNQGDVARVMSGTAAGVVEAYGKYAQGQTIIFAASVDEARDIVTLINRKTGHKTAALLLGNTPDRNRILDAFGLGIVKVLVNYAVLTEGVDTQCAETILIARPIARTNIGLYAQMVGRGLRLFAGKDRCIVIDCVGISNSPICTAATLIGRDVPADTPKAAATESDTPDDADDILDVLCGDDIPVSWIDYEKAIDVMAKGRGVDTHGVAWLPLPDGSMLLPIPRVIYRIDAPQQDGNVYVHKNNHDSKSAVPLQFALDYVYQDLRQKHPNVQHIWDKKQRRYWDNQPITHEQIQLIKRLSSTKIKTKNMTRGDASAMIQILLYQASDQTKEGKNNAPQSAQTV